MFAHSTLNLPCLIVLNICSWPGGFCLVHCLFCRTFPSFRATKHSGATLRFTVSNRQQVTTFTATVEMVSGTPVFPSVSQPNSSSFKNSSSEFVSEIQRTNTRSISTPVTGLGYETPVEKQLNMCQSCHKTFGFKSSFRRHLRSCKVKSSLCNGKRKLTFSTPQTAKKKRNIFDELSSSSDSDLDTHNAHEYDKDEGMYKILNDSTFVQPYPYTYILYINTVSGCLE